MIEEVGENDVKRVLSNFISENEEVENFIRYKAIEFAKRKWSITYLMSDDDTKNILGIFTLTSKAVQVNVSKLLSKKVKRIAKEFSISENDSRRITSTAFLLAQFSKNLKYRDKTTGEKLLEEALKVLEEVQTKVGGRLLWLECENTNIDALNFYKREEFGFQQFNTRYDEQSGVKYIQMIRSF